MTKKQASKSEDKLDDKPAKTPSILDKKEDVNALLQGLPLDMSRAHVISKITQRYVETLTRGDKYEPEQIAHELITLTRNAIQKRNLDHAKTDQWQLPTALAFNQIAELILALHHVAQICTVDGDELDTANILAVYMTEGMNEGVYVTKDEVFRDIGRAFQPDLKSKDFEEVMTILADKAPRKRITRERDLIPVNNGIFHYDTKTLTEFSPEYVFLTKSRVNYNPNATNPVFHNDTDNTDWDFDNWIEHDLFDDPEMVQLIWEILGAVIRPNVSWDKSAWFYSEEGSNGKGTLCQLLRNLCGPGSYASIPISDFGKDFMLEPLINAMAIIVDENDVGAYIETAANLKSVITNDVIAINRKWKTPIVYQFHGFMVQCLNAYPRFRDRSDSFYRRQLFVPFTKTFTGQERKYIKYDYMGRTEVLEYVMRRICESNYYELSNPEACQSLIREYKEFNDPVRDFFEHTINERCVWDLLPYDFCYELYRSQTAIEYPQSRPLGKKAFLHDLRQIANKSGDWIADQYQQYTPKQMMSKPEPLIIDYRLDKWRNSSYSGTDPDKICKPTLKRVYRGLIRATQISAPVQIDEGDADD